MKHEYEYKLIDGHIMVKDGNKQLLIDTGAPVSVGDSSPLAFAGGSYSMQNRYRETSPASLSKSVGTPVNALVGADILNRYDVSIDPIVQKFSLSEDEVPLVGALLGLDSFMGIPIVEARVGKDTVRMFFDTGAKLSYLDPERTNAFPSVGTESDFYPGIGDFSTNAFDIPIVLASENILLRVGNLPELLRRTLMMADTGGILGTAILRTHKVTFAPRRRTMTLQRISG
jgi:hypothetical protein